MIYYSIIIPHKNTPDLLQYCLDSIPIRDDVQVIVVDDDSDADKVDFKNFPRWKGANYEYYLTKRSGGTGYALNVGLDFVKGKWLVFSGADDYLLPAVDEVFNQEKDTDADIVYYRPKAVMLKDRISRSNRADWYNNIVDEYLNTHDEMPLRCRWFSPCSKLLKTELIRNHNIRFDEIRYSNDNLFSVKAGVNASKIEVRDKSFFCITESGNTLTSSFMQKPGELRIRTDAFFRAQQVIVDHGYALDEKVALAYLRKLFSNDIEAFMVNFNRMKEMGYKKSWLISELFKNNKPFSRIKRSVYVFLYSSFLT